MQGIQTLSLARLEMIGSSCTSFTNLLGFLSHGIARISMNYILHFFYINQSHIRFYVR